MSDKDTFEGKDLDEAIAAAASELGIPEDEMHYEVVEQGRKGLLGLGTRNVSIRIKPPVTQLTDQEILSGEDARALRAVERPEETPDQAPADARVEAVSEDAAAAERRDRRSRRSRRDRRDAAPPAELEGQALEVKQTLEKILELATLEIDVEPGERDDGVSLKLSGADRKMLKRRNAELLLGLQFLLNRMARRTWPGVGRIHLSTDGSSEGNRRDEQLIGLTRDAANQVSKTGKTRKLRPMNAYERRLVHLTVREFTGLTSSSDGSGSMKRVRISKVQNALNVQ